MKWGSQSGAERVCSDGQASVVTARAFATQHRTKAIARRPQGDCSASPRPCMGPRVPPCVHSGWRQKAVNALAHSLESPQSRARPAESTRLPRLLNRAINTRAFQPFHDELAGLAVHVSGVIEQKINALAVVEHRDPGLEAGIEVVADASQRRAGLVTVVDVINHLLFCGGRRGKDRGLKVAAARANAAKAAASQRRYILNNAWGRCGIRNGSGRAHGQPRGKGRLAFQPYTDRAVRTHRQGNC